MLSVVTTLTLLASMPVSAQHVDSSAHSTEAGDVHNGRYHDGQVRLVIGTVSAQGADAEDDARVYYLNFSYRSSNLTDSTGWAAGVATEIGVDLPVPMSDLALPFLPYAGIGYELRWNAIRAQAGIGLSIVGVSGGHTGGIVPLPFAQTSLGYDLRLGGTRIGIEAGTIHPAFVPFHGLFVGIAITR
jgi:hypothetical protein